ncbi:VOC family protein [Bradyrhizobium sp.]|uniref:VOC family protein n=2 Tax=Bradyrhizobium sp. TaxID=376 RepID=UPI003BC1BD77
MPHGLDHIVHAVRDVDAAADFYVRAGFMLGGRNRHPWGTHNRIVQLKNCYIEILEVAEPEKIVPHGPRFFSFGAFHRDFVAHREGFSMLLLNSRDAVQDARAFEAAGIGSFDVFDFAREGKRPDGSTVKLAFSLAFAAEPNSPDVRFAVCQHRFPENFWNPAFQTHANGAQRVPGVVMIASDPSRHRDFLKAYTGVSEVASVAAGVSAHTENGDVEILQPSAASDLFGRHVKTSGEGMTLSAMRFSVADLARIEALYRQNGLAVRRHAERLIVPPEEAFGATLVFEPAKVG